MSGTLIAAAEIGQALAKLAVARGGLLDDITAEVYLERLSRFDPVLVRRACAELSDVPRKAKETALPDVGKIIETAESLARTDAMNAAMKKLGPMPGETDHQPTYFCTDCFDEPGAWRLRWCQGVGEQRTFQRPDRDAHVPAGFCGRAHVGHAPHVYAERCACRDVNPVIARHRANQAAHVASRGSR